MVDWLIGGASPRCVRVGLSVSFGGLCATWWCALLVGKLLVLDLLYSWLAGWLVEDHVWWLLVGLRGDSMHWADGAAAEKQQILIGKLRISLLYDDMR